MANGSSDSPGTDKLSLRTIYNELVRMIREHQIDTYWSSSSCTEWPVSRAEEIRLFVKTSGDISLKTWCVARIRNTRADIALDE